MVLLLFNYAYTIVHANEFHLRLYLLIHVIDLCACLTVKLFYMSLKCQKADESFRFRLFLCSEIGGDLGKFGEIWGCNISLPISQFSSGIRNCETFTILRILM